MAETSRNGGKPAAGAASAELGIIPTGLYRIKTRRVVPKDRRSGSRAEDNTEKLNESPSRSAASMPAEIKQKRRGFVKARVKFHSPKQGLQKARKIGRWFTSHLSKYPDQPVGHICQDTEYDGSAANAFVEEVPTKEENKVGKPPTRKQTLPEDRYSNKAAKGLKSFSHELGPKGGIRPSHPRAHSMNDLKVLLGSFRSRFDAAKEVVNTELNCFLQEVKEVLQNKDSMVLDEHRIAEELLGLAQQCIGMAPYEFRTKCEAFVQELSGKRQQCQTGLVKWLLTRMLFILTRCTRLLHLEKDMEPVNETRLDKFQECLERLPFVETDLAVNRGAADYDTSYASHLINNVEGKVRNNIPAVQSRPEVPMNESDSTIGNDPVVIENKFSSRSIPNEVDSHNIDLNFQGKLEHKSDSKSFQEEEEYLDYSDLEICRICEESVPAIHLEPHSYICAYADKWDLKSSDVNERLWKMMELLQQLLESRNLRTHATYDSPNYSKMHTSNSAFTSEDCSPRISDWRSKGVEGMFEDLHEMDTAGIEDFQMANVINFKGYLSSKLNHGGPPSSTGSMTSTSSTNTPRAGSFDFSWLDGENPFELEDVQQIIDLVDIARCVADTDIAEERSLEYLLACIQDLQDVLLRSKFRALVVDTFGSRIENLLREKYVLACKLVDTRSDSRPPKSTRLMLENASESSSISTPLHPSHKERTRIEDFEIIKPISRGAFGKVFLARKRTTGDLFAIKVLKKLDLIRKNDIERILAERNILITVRNPFVVRFFYSFTSKDNLYLVMEYLNGGDLYSLLRKVGCLEEEVARVYVAELVRKYLEYSCHILDISLNRFSVQVLALEYIHSLGIVHRDLKPDNILIAQDGHIKLTDFGLSKIGLMNSTGDLEPESMMEPSLLGGHGQHSTDTDRVNRGQQSAVGTPDYLAPEILLGPEHGNAADWWSVGIILFELITGVPPFTAEHPEKIFDNILNRKVPWPAIPSEMSYEAQDLIDRFLHLEPNQRLGARGSSEVKAHPFFKGIDWNNLALLKAAFVPQPDTADDTSYFISRYDSTGSPADEDCSSASEDSELLSDSGLETMDECGDLADFHSTPLDLSLINFSFKNLSQLASINHDVLLQGGRNSPKCSSPGQAAD